MMTNTTINVDVIMNRHIKKLRVYSFKVMSATTLLESSRNLRDNKGNLKNKEVAHCNNITL